MGIPREVDLCLTQQKQSLAKALIPRSQVKEKQNFMSQKTKNKLLGSTLKITKKLLPFKTSSSSITMSLPLPLLENSSLSRHRFLNLFQSHSNSSS